MPVVRFRPRRSLQNGLIKHTEKKIGPYTGFFGSWCDWRLGYFWGISTGTMQNSEFGTHKSQKWPWQANNRPPLCPKLNPDPINAHRASGSLDKLHSWWYEHRTLSHTPASGNRGPNNHKRARCHCPWKSHPGTKKTATSFVLHIWKSAEMAFGSTWHTKSWPDWQIRAPHLRSKTALPRPYGICNVL